MELAASGGLPTLAVQHHHAHIASCMADNALKGKIIGVVLDGTGYGTDGNIWGGEFLIAGYDSFQRRGHLQYLPLPGGDAGIKRPYRIAAAYLRSLLGLSPEQIHGFLSRYASLEEFELVIQQISRGLNTPFTSSMGRLFDAVSALLGICGVIQYDAQAAIELEMKATACTDNIRQAYSFNVSGGNPYIISLKEIFGEIITDLQKGLSVQAISLKFHHSVAAIVLEMCRIIREDSGISDVTLSGGVFQNRLLLGISITALHGEGFSVYTHRDVPCNDGGISLGQAAVARATMI
jgi:hydrogenase maturation protein HypF